MKAFDRYSLLCFSVALILILTVFIGSEEYDDKDEILIGIVYEIHKTQNGYTFLLEDCCGEQIKCFARNEPADSGIYAVTGSYSDDRGILFVNSMRETDNEF